MADRFDKRDAYTEDLKAKPPVFEKPFDVDKVDAELIRNSSLIDAFLKNLFIKPATPEWVDMKVMLTRLSVKVDMESFPGILDHLSDISHKGSVKPAMTLLKLIEGLPMDMNSLEEFFKILMMLPPEDPMKSQYAAIVTLKHVDVSSWMEAVFYLDLFKTTDALTTEYAAKQATSLPRKSPIHFYFLIEMAKSGRIGIIDKYMDLAELVQDYRENISEEMKPIMVMLSFGQYNEIETYIAALTLAYLGLADAQA